MSDIKIAINNLKSVEKELNDAVGGGVAFSICEEVHAVLKRNAIRLKEEGYNNMTISALMAQTLCAVGESLIQYTAQYNMRIAQATKNTIAEYFINGIEIGVKSDE